MADSIRTLYAGLQAAPDAVPTTMSYIPYKLGTFSWTPKRERQEDEVETGALVKTTAVVAGANEDTISFSTDLYYTLNPLLMATVLNMPVSVAHPTAVGAYVHTEKEASNRPLVCFQFYDGVVWRQALNCTGNELDITIPNKTMPTAEYKFLAPSATLISAPTPVIEVLIAPIPWSHLLVTRGGVAYGDVISGKIAIKANREALHTARGTNEPKRFTEGKTVVTWEVLPDYTTDAGSLFAQYLSNVEPSPSSLTFSWVDPLTTIGTGTPTNPSFSVKINRALTKTGTHDMKPANTRTNIQGVGALSLTDGSAVKVEFVNTTTAYTAS